MFAAPETLMGYKATCSADIFSYGVVLLEIVTGERQERGRWIWPRSVRLTRSAVLYLICYFFACRVCWLRLAIWRWQVVGMEPVFLPDHCSWT